MNCLQKRILLPAICLALAGCGARPGDKIADNSSVAAVGKGTETAVKPLRRLSRPQPPAILTTDSARLNYVVAHHWDSFDRRDTTWIADTASMEQAFADWTGVLRYLPEAKAAENITVFFRSTEVCPPMRDRLLEVAERYWDDPNSPLRNEAWYIPVLEYVVASPAIEDMYKIRPRYQLAMARKNRPGMVAADFAYTLADNRTERLSLIRAEYTLLLFYNPDCADCARVETFIAQSGVMVPLIESGKMKMLAVYTDSDTEAWRKHAPTLPVNWAVAYDKGQVILGKELYDLRATPCLYLLDAKKHVILKDAPVQMIEAWLEQIEK